MSYNRRLQWRDSKRKWEDDQAGWYEYKIHSPDEYMSQADFMNWYREVIDWLYDSIDNCERHCRWAFDHNTIYIKFRHERDYLICILRW